MVRVVAMKQSKVNSIGLRIKALRGKESRASFSKRLGIGTSTLQRYEGDVRLPDLEVLMKIQAISGYTLEYLVHGIEKLELTDNERRVFKKLNHVSITTREKIVFLLCTRQIS